MKKLMVIAALAASFCGFADGGGWSAPLYRVTGSVATTDPAEFVKSAETNAACDRLTLHYVKDRKDHEIVLNVTDVVRDYEKVRNPIDNEDHPHANVYRWYLCKEGLEADAAALDWVLDEQMWAGAAFIGPAKIPVEMTSVWTNNHWTFSGVGHLPESLGGGDLPVGPFTGFDYRMDLPDPIGTIHVYAANSYRLDSWADVEERLENFKGGGGGGGGVDTNTVKDIIRDYRFPVDESLNRDGFGIKAWEAMMPGGQDKPDTIPWDSGCVWTLDQVSPQIDRFYQVTAWRSGSGPVWYRFSCRMTPKGAAADRMQIIVHCHNSEWNGKPAHVFTNGVETIVNGVSTFYNLELNPVLSPIASEHYVDVAVASAGGGTDGSVVTNIIENYETPTYEDAADVPTAGIDNWVLNGTTPFAREGDTWTAAYSSGRKIRLTTSWDSTNWVWNAHIQPYTYSSAMIYIGSFVGTNHLFEVRLPEVTADLTVTAVPDRSRFANVRTTNARFALKRDRDDNVFTKQTLNRWTFESDDPGAVHVMQLIRTPYYGDVQPTWEEADKRWRLWCYDPDYTFTCMGYTGTSTPDATDITFNVVTSPQSSYTVLPKYTNCTVRAKRDVAASPGQSFASAEAVDVKRDKTDLSVYNDDENPVRGDWFMKGFNNEGVPALPDQTIADYFEEKFLNGTLVWSDDYGDWVYPMTDPSVVHTIDGVEYTSLDWIPGTDQDTVAYFYFMNNTSGDLIMFAMSHYPLYPGKVKIPGDRLAKMSDVDEMANTMKIVQREIDGSVVNFGIRKYCVETSLMPGSPITCRWDGEKWFGEEDAFGGITCTITGTYSDGEYHFTLVVNQLPTPLTWDGLYGDFDLAGVGFGHVTTYPRTESRPVGVDEMRAYSSAACSYATVLKVVQGLISAGQLKMKVDGDGKVILDE